MKRSEMVTYLTKLLNTYENCQLGETEANEILEGLEHIGMLPPRYEKITFYDLEGWSYSSSHMEWKPE